MVGYRPLDFGTNFLMVLISNFLLYLLYYAVTKCIYKEVHLQVASFRPLGFFLLSLIFWSIGVYSYLLVSELQECYDTMTTMFDFSMRYSVLTRIALAT